MTPCPTCSRPVDPLRARAVVVRDGKILAYCSTECAAQADPSKPTAVPTGMPAARTATPARGVPPHPPPRSTPPKGVPVPTTPARGTPARSVRDFDSGPVIEIIHEPVSGVVTSARDERVPTGPITAPVAKPEVPFDPDDDDDDDDDGDAAAGDGAGEKADAKGDPPQAGMRTLRERRDSLNVKAAWDWLDDEPAEPVGRVEPRGKARGVFVFLLVLALAGGGGYLAYKYLYLSHSASAQVKDVRVVPGSVQAVPPPKPEQAKPQPPAVKPLDRALAVLRAHLTSTLRVQRFAAAALARTGDAAAIELLAKAVAQDAKLEPAGKLEIAYALARGHDKRGTELLVAGLGSPSRDVKLAAGTLLCRLGDQRAAYIASYLEYSQHRLSVATELARIREPHAIKTLDAVHADPKSSTEDKARAAIGLGIAGRADVAAELHALLDDTHFNMDAANGLVVLRDEGARAVLVKLLDTTSLRVVAAGLLRQLAPNADLSQQVAKLAAALDDPEQKDTVQIELAETIVLLAGQASYSEYR
jgi:hypothetical protein